MIKRHGEEFSVANGRLPLFQTIPAENVARSDVNETQQRVGGNAA